MVDEYDDRMIVGEVALQDLHRVVGYLASGDQLHLAHNFVFVDLPWDCDAFRTSIDDFEALADRAAWPAWFLSNHDKSRVATRFGGPAGRARSLLILYALRGTPFIYQGEELGLPDAEIPADRVVDVDGRDPERAPIPWTRRAARRTASRRRAVAAVLAGAAELSAEAQAADPRSTLSLVRRLAALRRDEPALQSGSQRTLDAGENVLAWMRGEEFVAAVNFGTAPAVWRCRARWALHRPRSRRRPGRRARSGRGRDPPNVNPGWVGEQIGRVRPPRGRLAPQPPTQPQLTFADTPAPPKAAARPARSRRSSSTAAPRHPARHVVGDRLAAEVRHDQQLGPRVRAGERVDPLVVLEQHREVAEGHAGSVWRSSIRRR